MIGANLEIVERAREFYRGIEGNATGQVPRRFTTLQLFIPWSRIELYSATLEGSEYQ